MSKTSSHKYQLKTTVFRLFRKKGGTNSLKELSTKIAAINKKIDNIDETLGITWEIR